MRKGRNEGLYIDQLVSSFTANPMELFANKAD